MRAPTRSAERYSLNTSWRQTGQFTASLIRGGVGSPMLRSAVLATCRIHWHALILPSNIRAATTSNYFSVCSVALVCPDVHRPRERGPASERSRFRFGQPGRRSRRAAAVSPATALNSRRALGLGRYRPVGVRRLGIVPLALKPLLRRSRDRRRRLLVARKLTARPLKMRTIRL
jgi:hypothetical protein